jgi:hypothetical protein
VLSLAGEDPRGDGDYEVTDTGESTHNAVKTIAQGRPGVAAEPVVNNSCAFFVAHEAAGAASTRLSLRPLFFRGDTVARPGRKTRRGNVKL